MRSKSIVLLALALGCGLVASIGISQVMERRNQANSQPGEVEPIIVALHDINPNEPITDQNVKIEEWPKTKVPQGSITTLEQYANKRARTKFYAGEPILAAKIMDENEVRSASRIIPKGYRVVAVKVDAVSGGGSLILPGDRVDILLFLNKNPAAGIMDSKTQTVLQDIKVFAVDTAFQHTPDQDEPAIAAKTISLLVTPEQAEKVTLASEMGSIRLTLRNDQSDEVVQSDGTDADDMLGTDGSNRKAEQARPGSGANTAAMVSGATSAAKSLLDLIKQQREVTKPVAAVQEDKPWKMMIYKGSEIEEMEIGSDGLPVVLGEAGDPNSTPTPLPPTTTPSSDPLNEDEGQSAAPSTDDSASGLDRDQEVSLKQ